MRRLYETDRFFLRPFIQKDITENYLGWFQDPDVTRYTSHGLGPYTKDQAIKFLKNSIKSGHVIWAIMLKRFAWSKNAKKILGSSGENQRVHIGNIALQNIDRENISGHTAEFACIIGEKDYWGQGIGTEAIKILFAYGFQTLNLHRIWLGTTVTNIGMKRVAEKLGMTEEYGFHKENEVDTIQYGILKEEWPKNKKG